MAYNCMAYNFLITKHAEHDLDEVVRYIAVSLSNPSAAEALYNKLLKSIELICEFPESGTKIENKIVSNKEIRKVFVDNYILYYLFKSETVYILRFLYSKRSINEIITILNTIEQS